MSYDPCSTPLDPVSVTASFDCHTNVVFFYIYHPYCRVDWTPAEIPTASLARKEAKINERSLRLCQLTLLDPTPFNFFFFVIYDHYILVRMLDRKCYTSLQIDFYFKDFCLKLELQSLYFFFLKWEENESASVSIYVSHFSWGCSSRQSLPDLTGPYNCITSRPALGGQIEPPARAPGSLSR